jgi:type IX secretion system PorP/SprF family membrane protein
MNKLYTSLAILTLSVSAQAQNLPFDFYSFKMNNMYNINPAYTGKTDGIAIVLDARAQSKGVPNATKNLMAGVHGKFTDNQAIGGRVVSDGRGAFQLLKADFTYASKIKLATQHALTLGLSAGVFNKSLAVSRIENYASLDQTDPTLSYFNTTQFIGGVGALYTYKTLEVSVSSPHLVETSQAVNQFMNASVAYTFKASKDINVTPWLCYQNVPVVKNITSLFVKSSYKDVIWLQLGYQSNKSLGAMFGANIDNFGMGYGFQFNNKATKTIAVGTHEIAFTFKINKRNKVAATTNSTSENNNTSMLSIINRLDNLTANNSMSKADLRTELEKIKVELKKLSASNFAGENPDVIEKNINVIDKKIKEIETQLR